MNETQTKVISKPRGKKEKKAMKRKDWTFNHSNRRLKVILRNCWGLLNFSHRWYIFQFNQRNKISNKFLKKSMATFCKPISQKTPNKAKKTIGQKIFSTFTGIHFTHQLITMIHSLYFTFWSSLSTISFSTDHHIPIYFSSFSTLFSFHTLYRPSLTSLFFFFSFLFHISWRTYYSPWGIFTSSKVIT